jgi:hypothetical protein
MQYEEEIKKIREICQLPENQEQHIVFEIILMVCDSVEPYGFNFDKFIKTFVNRVRRENSNISSWFLKVLGAGIQAPANNAMNSDQNSAD